MKLPLRACLLLLLGAVLACSARAWGDQPVKLIVPAPAGGTMDIVARVLGQQLSADLGQPVVVDNRPGAGGAIGIQAMLKAAPDGNTLVVAASNVLAEIPHVRLPTGDVSQYHLRMQPNDFSLCTLEAIARALGIVESPDAQQQLEWILRVMVERTLWSRGQLPAEQATAAGIPPEARRHSTVPRSGDS